MSRNNHEWFKFEFRSWLESRRVRRMSLAAQGLYIRALSVQAALGNIPANLDDFALEAKVRPSELTVWDECVEHFDSEEVDGERFFYNKKLREFLTAAAEKKAKLADNGRTGGKAKRKAKAKANASSNAKPKAEAKASLRASSSYSLSNSTSNSLEDFNNFWTNFPSRRRKDKQGAMAAWEKAVTSPELAQQIIAHVVDRAAKDPDWLKEGGEYVPMPTTFLNGARWEDSYSTAHPTAQKPRAPQTPGERRNAEMQQHTDPKSRRLTPEEQAAAKADLDEKLKKLNGDESE